MPLGSRDQTPPWLGLGLTREGLRFTLLIGIIAFAAYNTRNNLLYLMLSVGLATLVVSFLVGWCSLRRLRVLTTTESEFFAGTVGTEELGLENRSSWLDIFGLEVVDRDSLCRPGASRQAGGRPRVELTAVLRGSVARCRLEKAYSRRGVFESERIDLLTRFPFGLFRFCRSCRLPRRLTVFPRIEPLDPELELEDKLRASIVARRRGQTEEFFRLRDYVSGDNTHHIHWRSTAKLNRLVVREFAEATDERLCLALVPVETPECDFEDLVKATASMANYLSSMGFLFRFVSSDRALAPSPSPDHLRAILTYLATVEPRPSAESWSLVTEQIRAAERSGEAVLLMVSDGIAAPPMIDRDSAVETLTPGRVLGRRSSLYRDEPSGASG